MLVTVAIAVAVIVALCVLKRRGIALDRRAMIIAVLIEAAAVAVSFSEGYGSGGFDGTLKRNDTGGGSYEEALIVDDGTAEYEVTVDVAEREPEADEAFSYIDSAIAEIEEEFLGSNPDTGNVYERVVIRESYVGGIVDCVWSFDDHGVMEADGSIRLERVEAPTEVTAYAELSCGEYSSEYELSYTVVPPPEDTEAGFRYLLSRLIKNADSESRTADMLTLPDEAGGRSLKWSEPASHTGEELALCGMGALLAMLFAGREEERRREKKRHSALSRDYPDIVSRLSLFVGAGISVKAAFERMGAWYAGQAETERAYRPGFEAVMQVNRRIADGVGEAEAYRLLGEDTGHKDYRKLSLMLRQNLRKGSRDMIEQLEKEERSAYEERKLAARIAGEEASTKLLIPMLGMLGVLLVVLIVPAIWGMDI